jgi:phosphoserine aminotransferase
VYNLKGSHSSVSFANTGHWSEKAIKEASYLSNGIDIILLEVHVPITVKTNDQGLEYIPDFEQWDYDPNSAFLHYCDNETADGLEFQYTPKFTD